MIQPPTVMMMPITSQANEDFGTDLICWAQASIKKRKPRPAIVIPVPIKASADIFRVPDWRGEVGSFM